MIPLHYLAQINLDRLAANTYPGRGLVVGLDATGTYLIQASWIMGRSENSRNRVYQQSGGRVFTQAADPAKMKDPRLIIYNAMDEKLIGDKWVNVVSNGNQTDTVLTSLTRGATFFGSLIYRGYEPDKPHFTPRITAISRRFPKKHQPVSEIAVLRKSRFSEACDRNLYQYFDWSQGFGYCVTTYEGDGEPLPPFYGEPRLIPLDGTIEIVTDTLWNMLNSTNRVALAVKFIGDGISTVKIVNRYESVRS